MNASNATASKPKSRLGMAMTGGRRGRKRPDGEGRQTEFDGEGRQHGDFYPTPAEATRALVLWLKARGLLDFNAPVIEPACGAGAMATALEAEGLKVIASDLYDRGYGETGACFLTLDLPRRAQIITNPPYRDDLPDRFIRRASGEARLLCLLLKATYWNAGPGNNGKPSRDCLWRFWRPSAVLALTWRLDFMGLGAPTMDCAWNVWINEPAYQGRTIYDRLARPSGNLDLFEEETR